MPDPETAQALVDLDSLTRRLRRECPWDREQDERSIVPHTLEEAYELADAACAGDDAKLIDELGDVLFQIHFLSLLLEERGAGDLAQVAEHCRQKLIRRHPHVFGETDVADAAEVLSNWDAIKATEPGREPGVFGEVPENLPALLYARKLQRRAASAGLYPPPDALPRDRGSVPAETVPRDEVPAPAEAVPRDEDPAPADAVPRDPDSAPADAARRDQECFRDIGERLFALVDEARRQQVDPELALRAAAHRFRERLSPEIS